MSSKQPLAAPWQNTSNTRSSGHTSQSWTMRSSAPSTRWPITGHGAKPIFRSGSDTGDRWLRHSPLIIRGKDAKVLSRRRTYRAEVAFVESEDIERSVSRGEDGDRRVS